MISDITFEDIERTRSWFESPTEIIDNGKSTNILWSGGLDSTFLLISLLIKGYRVRSYYVEIENNAGKNSKEAIARREIANVIFESFPSLTRNWENSLNPEQRFSVPNNQRPDIKQAIYWVVSTQVETYFSSNYCISYVNGDDSIYYIPAIEQIVKGFNMMSSKSKINVYFPMKRIKKQWFFSSLPEQITDHTYWCELGQDKNVKCYCPACVRHRTDLPTGETND